MRLLNKVNLRFPNQPEVLFELAFAYHNLRLYEEAIKTYAAVLELAPNDPRQE